MGIQCQILINKPKEGIHRAGQPVSGKVRYIVDESTEYKHVTLSFLGKGKCVWRQGSGKNRRTYRGTEDYIVTHINVFNKKPEDTITLEGEYEHFFEFYLPEDIPRSYKDYIGCISYSVVLKFEKPEFFSFNKVFTAEIPVYNYLKAPVDGPVIFGLQKELFAPFALETPVINLKGEIEKTFLTPGENIHLSYEVINNTDVEITSVKTDLHRYITYTSNGGTKKHLVTTVENCEAHTSIIPERKSSRFTCVLPTLPDLYSMQNSKVINIEYKVRTTVRLPMPHINATVEMPVLIGELKTAVDTAIEVLEDGEEPPSYWEAMSEGKKGEGKSDSDSE